MSLAALVGLLLNMAGFEYLYWLVPCVLFGLVCGLVSGLAVGSENDGDVPVSAVG